MKVPVDHVPCAADAVEHAVRAYPQEACGLVVVARGRAVYVECENTADSPEHTFRISPQAFAAAEARGEIIGLIHSHPEASCRPSDADRVQCELTGIPWHIISIHKDLITGEVQPVEAYELMPSGWEAPLVGRQFQHGILDCYTLVKDFYSRELGIELPHIERQDNWWEKGENLYLDNYISAGFKPVEGELKRGDLILMQIRSTVPNHGGVYLGNTEILHHLYGRLSSRDVYGGYLRDATTLILRHQDSS